MKCPIRKREYNTAEGIHVTEWQDCMLGDCAWWEEHLGKCCMAVEAYLKGVADRRLEVKESQRDRY